MGAMLFAPIVAGQSLESEFRKEGTRVRAAYDELTEIFQASSAVVYDDWKKDGYGVVVSSDGQVLVKASELPALETLSLRIGRKKYSEVEVLATSADWDVSLLKVDAEGLTAIEFSESEPGHGSIVLSNGATSNLKRRAQMGVIAANAREVGEGQLAVLGIQMDGSVEGEVKVGGISPQSGAKDAGMEKGDQILSIEGEAVAKNEEVAELLRGRKPGEMIKILVRREAKQEKPLEVEDPFAHLAEFEPSFEELEFEVELRERQIVFPEQFTRNDMMSGKFSERRTNFPRILQHDTSLADRTTGGPLLTLDGKCVGMNIAYVSRECSYAIPAKELQELLGQLRAEAGMVPAE
ncbi:hypothetical protein GCM10007100_34950 [Roseibacillus persicicus]|uniref:PDZ domain-containing protein n=2 Tax=Roseibacillus persicicus TaxID=454148 RepID=A0A918TW09_9BACT|nr:hypothetical protein GCM10007100_34950 [Roseibacillus persicicus]